MLAEEVALDADDLAAAAQVGFTEEEAVAFKGVYNHYDQNFGKGDGRCSVQLVKSMVRALGIVMTKADEEQLAQMLDAADENKDGEFDLCIAVRFEVPFSRVLEGY